MARYNSGWQQFAEWRVSPSMLVLRSQQALAALVRAGLRAPAGNRIERAMRLVEASNIDGAVESASEAELTASREAFRSLWEFFLIAYTVLERQAAAASITPQKVATMLKGADVATGESNPTGRNMQFELMIASVFILGGAEVVDGEPDLRVTYDGASVGIAAKRVQSLNESTLRSTMKDAARQIRRSTGTGFVALNLDSWITALKTGEEVEALGASFGAQITAAHDQLYQLSDRAALLGGLFFGTWFGWNKSNVPARLEFHMPQQMRCFAATGEDEDKCRSFFQPLRQQLAAALNEIGQLVSQPAAYEQLLPPNAGASEPPSPGSR